MGQNQRGLVTYYNIFFKYVSKVPKMTTPGLVKKFEIKAQAIMIRKNDFYLFFSWAWFEVVGLLPMRYLDWWTLVKGSNFNGHLVNALIHRFTNWSINILKWPKSLKKRSSTLSILGMWTKNYKWQKNTFNRVKRPHNQFKNCRTKTFILEAKQICTPCTF